MTFDQYWQSIIDRGLEDRADIKSAAQSAWDAALCSASAACMKRGQLREPAQIHCSISKLHTW